MPKMDVLNEIRRLREFLLRGTRGSGQTALLIDLAAIEKAVKVWDEAVERCITLGAFGVCPWFNVRTHSCKGCQWVPRDSSFCTNARKTAALAKGAGKENEYRDKAITGPGTTQQPVKNRLSLKT